MNTEILYQPLFWLLLGVVLALLLVINTMSNVLRMSAKGKYEREKKDSAAGKGTIVAILLLISSAGYLIAEPAAPATAAKAAGPDFGGIGAPLFYLFVGLIVVEFLVIIFLQHWITRIIRVNEVNSVAEVKAAVKEAATAKKPRLNWLDRFNASKAIEEEKDIMLDHDYDGIRELDNDLPPWWRYSFYISVVWACAYFAYYHIGEMGDTQTSAYDKEMREARIEHEEMEARLANKVNENVITDTKDPKMIANGREEFKRNCTPCHGENAEGKAGNGPNLTDNYWLHGGNIKDIFKSIKYGYPEKGMKSWKDELSASQIANLSTYIRSIAGSNPPGAKEPQGELYVEKQDSTAKK